MFTFCRNLILNLNVVLDLDWAAVAEGTAVDAYAHVPNLEFPIRSSNNNNNNNKVNNNLSIAVWNNIHRKYVCRSVVAGKSMFSLSA